jgi:alkylation response protein AidB-like acyl-CoA dehydrogenase
LKLNNPSLSARTAEISSALDIESAARAGAPSAAELLARARAFRPTLNAGADVAETQGSLTPEAADFLRYEGFVGMWVPKELGGLDLSPLEILPIIEALTYADCSVGWVLSTASLAAGAAGVFLGEDAVDTMFRGDAPPFMAGQGVPNGKAEAVPAGGYRLNGSWNYGSGIKHANFVCVGAGVYEGGRRRVREGAPENRFFFLPRDSVILADNWDVLGLRGTGSVDHSVSDLFVSEGYTFPAIAPQPLRKSYAALGFGVLAPVGHGAFALGIGQRMLDEIARFAESRKGRPGAIGDSESFLEEYARARARFRAARALIVEVWEEAQDVFARGSRTSVEQDSFLRLSMIQATNVVADICTFGYRIAGGTSLRKSVIQRLFRDIHAGMQHIICSTPMLRACGRDLLVTHSAA